METNDAHITQLNSYYDNTSETFFVTLKINKFEISDIVATFQRYDYTVKYYFGEELFDHTGIEFNANTINEELKNQDLPLSYKRHILLIFKEVMHNSLKHAKPSSTYLDLERSKP